MRFDIISDTHGFLSKELLEALTGADALVHAGDMCSASDFKTLSELAPLYMCLGNNDWAYTYGPDIKNKRSFLGAGLRWQINHYRERLDLATCDIAVCGHTHRPYLGREGATLVINPGSPTYPRGSKPSMGRIIAEDGRIISAEIIELT